MAGNNSWRVSQKSTENYCNWRNHHDQTFTCVYNKMRGNGLVLRTYHDKMHNRSTHKSCKKSKKYEINKKHQIAQAQAKLDRPRLN